MARSKRSKNLLECLDDNFLVQVLDRLSRGEALLNVVLIIAEEIIKGVKSEGSNLALRL